MWANPAAWNEWGCYNGAGDERSWVPNPYACAYRGYVPRPTDCGATCTLFTPCLGGLFCGCCVPVTVNRAKCGQYVALMLALQIPVVALYLAAVFTRGGAPSGY